MRSVISVAALVLAAALIAAAPRAAEATPPSHPPAKKGQTVIIEGLQYRPRVVVARRGEPVTWINQDFVPHTVTAVGGGFDSHSIAPNGSWTYVPKKPGEYDYKCIFHPTMKGKLDVR